VELMREEIKKVRDYINKIRPWCELNERETFDRIIVMRMLDNIENYIKSGKKQHDNKDKW